MVKQYGLVHAKRKSNGKKGKPVKTAAQLNAQAGKFSFTEINGFKLKEVEWTVPDKKRVNAGAAVLIRCAKNF